MIVRVTEPQKECWAEAADLRGLSLAEFIRESVDERAGCDESGAGSSAGVGGASSPEVPAPETSKREDVGGGGLHSSAPDDTSSRSEVLKTVADVKRVLTERGRVEVASPSQPPSQAAPRSVRTRSKVKVEKGDGKCRAYAPKGTKCKMCGKMHP